MTLISNPHIQFWVVTLYLSNDSLLSLLRMPFFWHPQKFGN